MASHPVLPVHLDDVVEMRKQHPCGGKAWTVTRVGMDIGLQCMQCKRRVMLSRTQFERQLRRFIEQAPEAVPDSQDTA